VVRFRSPGPDSPAFASRVTYTDLVRGELTMDANRNDVVILKSSDSPLRLPTYHFAHAVDDHLMRVTHVVRGDEWLSSVPVHLQLFDAAGFERIPYAHIAPLLKQDGSAKQAQGPRGLRRVLHRGGLPGSGGALLPARPDQRLARGAAAHAGARGAAAPR
jgi:glutamyl-tRNA synthetase